MSQSKVDQKKYEKKHRKEILRKQKIKKNLAIASAIVVIAAILGSVIGVQVYRVIPKYVKADSLNEFIDETWKDSGYEGLLPATSTDAEDTEELADDGEADTEADDTSEASE